MGKDYQMFLHQQSTTDEPECVYFISGSLAELPMYYTAPYFTDLDMMYFSRDRCAISTEDFRPENFKGRIYFIENIPDCPGYVRLRTGCEYLKRKDFFRKDFSTDGPSYEDKLSISHRWINSESRTSMKKSDYQHKGLLVDFVQCIVSPHWPLQANEWATRNRTNDWPSKDIIARIVDDGCHLVRKSHPNCPNDDEMFRFSFSKAEVILIKTWNSVQKYIYHLVRQVKRQLEMKWKSENHESEICTYFFKTLMFWACEEKCTEFWNECNIRSSLQELLLEATEWLIERRCPNYFIPECNMLDHLQAPDFNFEKEIRDILEASKNNDIPIPKAPNSHKNIIISFPFPNKYLVFMQLTYSHSIGYLRTSNKEWLSSSSTSESSTFSPLIREEFRDLYLGISEQYRFVTGCHSQLFLSKASRHLNRSVMDDRRCSIMELNLDDTLEDFHESIHVTSVHNRHESGHESWWKNESRNQWNIFEREGVSDSPLMQNQHTIPETLILFMEDYIFTSRRAPKSKFNLFDMLRPSFGVSASYLANFHYSTQKDYDLAIRICEEVSTMLTNDFIENSSLNSSEGNPRAVILNNKLIVLFDQQIQTVFGFIALVKGLQLNGCGGLSKEAHISEFSGQQLSCDENAYQAGSRIFCRLSTYEFLNYVHYRGKLHKYSSDAEQSPEKEHEVPTCPDFSLDRSSVILSAAARISRPRQ